MTERAREREIYKTKQRTPAPEVPKPKAKKEYKPKKIFYLQHRYTAAAIKREEDQHKAWEKEYGAIYEKKYGHRIVFWLRRNREWMNSGKYADYKTAEDVMEMEKRKSTIFKGDYEYRIITKEELQKEKK